MTTSDLYRTPRPTISFELYPPRTPAGEAQAWEAVERLCAARPDYFSVTYGASGSTASRSQALVRRILTETDVTVIAHLTCVGRTRSELRAIVEEFLDAGVRNFLALRGDPPAGQEDWTPDPDGLATGSELVALIREVEAERFGARPQDPLERLAARHDGREGVSIAVAAYPGLATPDGFAADEQDLLALRAKQEAGADFAITQVFFEPEAYTTLTSAAHRAGITLPLVPGVLPLTGARRIRRLCELNGIPEPAGLLERLDNAPDEETRTRLGLDETSALIRGVVRAGAPGLHLYTFNRHEGVLALLQDVLTTAPPEVLARVAPASPGIPASNAALTPIDPVTATI